MRRHVLTIIMMFLMCCNACAQAVDEFCGDWVGTYTVCDWDPDARRVKDVTAKMYIRINKVASDYTVRIKVQRPGASMHYWPTCENVSQQDGTLYFTMNLGDDYDWDEKDKKNGQRIKYSNYMRRSSVSVAGGTLCYKDYLITTYYGYSGKIGEEYAPVNGYLTEVTLYKDDGW